MKLTDTEIGTKVKVTDLDELSEVVRSRLYDMGIMEGTVVCLRKKLPFSGPCTIESNGQCVAIRCNEACEIKVENV